MLRVVIDKKDKRSTTLLSEVCLSQQLSRMKRSLEEEEKRDRVKVALENMNNLREEQRKTHIEIENEKHALAKIRKEKRYSLEKTRISSLNR